MQQIYLEASFRTGYCRLMNYISNICHLREDEQVEIKRRVKIIEFSKEYGFEITMKAFGASRSTIFEWKQRLKEGGGRLSSLAPKSKAPKMRCKRVWDPRTVDFILKYRNLHPGTDKVTLKPLVDAFCLCVGIKTISESTIGRIVTHLKQKELIAQYQVRTTINGKTGRLRVRGTTKREKKLRIKDYKAQEPGDVVQIDAIDLFLNGIHRYIITALDIKTRFAFAYSYKTLSSNTAKDFMMRLQTVAPFPITHIQTDNGKEFHKFFRQYVKAQNIIHFYNYPRCPKMNTFVERFNRTIQDQYVSWHMEDLYEPTEFNPGLMNYLIWYNTEKIHRSLNKQTPLGYFVNNFVPTNESSMLWTSTST